MSVQINPCQTSSLSYQTPDTKMPMVVNEELVSQFKYWHNEIRLGMRYQNELYSYIQSYPLSTRLKAYDAAQEKAEQGFFVCITVSKTAYSIWVSLRSPSLATGMDHLNLEN